MGQYPAPPPDRLSPWYKTEDEAQVAFWLSLADNGDWGMLLFGPGGMGETGLIAASGFNGSVSVPPEEIRLENERGLPISAPLNFPGSVERDDLSLQVRRLQRTRAKPILPG